VRYRWPGNVRELQNFIERAVILSPHTTLRAPTSELEPFRTPKESELSLTGLAQLERDHILRALEASNWVIAGPNGAAVRLGDDARAPTATEARCPITSGATSGIGAFLRDAERRHIESALAATNWVIEGNKGASKILGLHPNTLRSRMKKLDIQRPDRGAANGEPGDGSKRPS
jgi:transcriptional regulator with GAF, ATPase, and Fis domain